MNATEQLTIPDAPDGLVVVKVGGSLFDHPRLGSGLRKYLDRLVAPRVLVVAGGGRFADVVRDLDTRHVLGDETAHQFVLRACHLSQWFLGHLLGSHLCTSHLPWWASGGPRVLLLNYEYFLMRYENVHHPVPHSWDLTSDSIAAYAASLGRAKLVLLKSTDIPPDTSWQDAADHGWVDAHFPSVVAKHRLSVEAVNFRRWLDRYVD